MIYEDKINLFGVTFNKKIKHITDSDWERLYHPMPQTYFHETNDIIFIIAYNSFNTYTFSIGKFNISNAPITLENLSIEGIFHKTLILLEDDTMQKIVDDYSLDVLVAANNKINDNINRGFYKDLIKLTDKYRILL
jgi:hypothetical protein